MEDLELSSVFFFINFVFLREFENKFVCIIGHISFFAGIIKGSKVSG
jgi:hypothetical protein